MALDQFLGLHRSRIEGLLGQRADQYDRGWVKYGRGWALRYEEECAVELVVRLPGGIGCTDPFLGIGFGGRDPAHRKRDGCRWPEGSVRHSLGPSLAGELEFASGLFRARLLGKARACRPAGE